MRFRDKFNRFMQGRNGFDLFCKYLFILYIILWIVNIFVRSTIINIIMLAIFAYMVFRVLSKNIYRRRWECYYIEKFDNWLKTKIALTKRRWTDRKTHVYRTCPSCHQTIRLPRKKGTHTVECPKCRKDFKVHILW